MPAVIKLAMDTPVHAHAQHSPCDVRLAAGRFIRHFCAGPDFTRKMFIACGGLQALVRFLDAHICPCSSAVGAGSHRSALVRLGIDGLRLVFKTTTNPKNDFYRLLCKFSLLPSLCRTFKEVTLTPTAFAEEESSSYGGSSVRSEGSGTGNGTDSEDERRSQSFRGMVGTPRGAAAPNGLSSSPYAAHIAALVFGFSQGDTVVKQALAQPTCVGELLAVVDRVPAAQLVLLVKAIRNLSMDDRTLDGLEAAGVIHKLVPLLALAGAPEVPNQVLMCMHYMCKIKTSRQEALAQAGIVPYLQKLVVSDHPLKQFALPMIKSLALCSKYTRYELKKFGGVEFFLRLLDTLPYWQVSALDAIVAWLAEDAARVDVVVAAPAHIATFVHVLQRCRTNRGLIESVLNQLQQLMRKLPKLTRTLGDVPPFTTELIALLDRETAAIVRKPLLTMLRLLFDRLPSQEVQADYVVQHQLVTVLRTLVTEDASELVQTLAQDTLDAFVQVGIAV